MNCKDILNMTLLKELIQSALFNEGPVVIFIWKNEANWPVESVSKNIERLYGYLPEEYTNGKLQYVNQIHADDRERVFQEILQSSKEKNLNSFEHEPYRYMDKHDVLHWVKENTVIIRDEYGNITHYIGYLTDISQEMHLKEETEIFKERLSLAWEGVNDGVWDWNIEKNIVYFSPRWKGILGYGPDEISDEVETFFALIHPEDQQRLQTVLENHWKNPSQNSYKEEIRLLCKDGTYKWVLTRGSVILNDKGLPHRMLGSHTDISEQVENRIKLEDRETELRHIFENTQAGLMYITGDRICLKANKHLAGILGYDSPEDLIGLNMRSFHLNEKNFIEFGKKNYEPLQNGVIHDIEYPLKKKDGTAVWCELSGKAIDGTIPADLSKGALWTIKDLSLRKEYEYNLKESELLKHNILSTLPNMMWLKDIDGKYVFCSPEFERFFGAQEKDIVGKTDYDFVDKDLADFFREHDKNAMNANAAIVSEEWIDYASDGSRALLEITKTSLSNTKGELIGVLGVGHNVTKRHEEEVFKEKYSKVLKMIATGVSASQVYDEIALMYEERNPGMRCSLLEVENGVLLHGGAPSMPKQYCDAVNGLKNGPQVGSCGASTYTGKRMIVENIETHPNWAEIKQFALPHGMRSCWSEPIKSSSGEVLGAFGMYYDYPASPNKEELEDLISAARLAGIIMEREKSQKHIKKLAYSDILTSLPNRASFYQKLESLINSSNRKEDKFAVLYIDLDDFKNVNDTLGHDIGDILLKEVAKRLKHVSRDNDFTARLSGDEFCLLVGDIDDDYDAAYVAKRCLEALSKPLLLSNRNFTPACSIGIAHYPDDAKDIDTLLKAADTALYFSKENGKNKYSFYTPDLTVKAERLFQVEQYLRVAIEQKELTIVYQPQIDTVSNKVFGVEALSRWNHPILGEVSPVEFIPIAEKLGLIKDLTKWVLKTASCEAVRWSDLGYTNIRMSVNISPTHFLDKGLVDLVKSTIQSSGITPSNLELEVTENVVHTDEENLLIFKDLKELGVLIAIDDFGTGYSSFASLKHLCIDCIKLDKYFIDDMLHDEESQLLVKAMIQLGHSLKHGVIAEGVETQQQADMLKKLNCQALQGYLLSKPLTSQDMLKFLEKGL